jgi:hypothetical protein
MYLEKAFNNDKAELFTKMIDQMKNDKESEIYKKYGEAFLSPCDPSKSKQQVRE